MARDEGLQQAGLDFFVAKRYPRDSMISKGSSRAKAHINTLAMAMPGIFS
jgi:hypothetical protein